MTTSQQSDKKTTKQVRIDAEIHLSLKLKATKRKMSIKTLLEGYIVDGLDKDKDL